MDKDEFTPLTEEELRDFRDEVWNSYAIGELTEDEAVGLIMHELYVNGIIEA